MEEVLIKGPDATAGIGKFFGILGEETVSAADRWADLFGEERLNGTGIKLFHKPHRRKNYY